jgi:hypothetical protein
MGVAVGISDNIGESVAVDIQRTAEQLGGKKVSNLD